MTSKLDNVPMTAEMQELISGKCFALRYVVRYVVFAWEFCCTPLYDTNFILSFISLSLSLLYSTYIKIQTLLSSLPLEIQYQI